jgi:chemotaxis protein MotB
MRVRRPASRVASLRNAHPIIIKRVKKVVGGGHHGGAWKVAYADFVTAMMAFFLLMWLLNATTEDQRKGIADYFNPSIPISQVSGGGKDALNGTAVFSEKELAQDGSDGHNTMVREEPDKLTRKDEETKAAEEGALEAVQEDLLQQALSEEGDALAKHIQTRMTPDGLVIELVDVADRPLFESGSAAPSATMVKLLQIVASAVTTVTNQVAVVGHTDSTPYTSKRDYTNWELSSDRANTARRLMVAAGMSVSQVAEVSGKADTEPLTADKSAPQNRRISITLLRQ